MHPFAPRPRDPNTHAGPADAVRRLESVLHDGLRGSWPQATEADIAVAVDSAVEALETFDLVEDEEAEHLGRAVAQRSMALRLGTEREEARLDPVRRRAVAREDG